MTRHSIAAARAWLSTNTSLDPLHSDLLLRCAAYIFDHANSMAPATLGIGGAPGTGKSTLAHACAAMHERAMVVSLDNYYFSRAKRRRLAQDIHPLLAMRGPAGTHDLPRLCHDLDRLASGDHAGFTMPVFDKHLDERAEHGTVVPGGYRAELILLEGWLVGASPHATEELTNPVNKLESDKDQDQVWRRHVNAQLQAYANSLTQRMSYTCVLAAPSWEHVVRWRWQQEQDLDQRWLEDEAAVRTFLAPFERWCKAMIGDQVSGYDLAIRVRDDRSLAWEPGT